MNCNVYKLYTLRNLVVEIVDNRGKTPFTSAIKTTEYKYPLIEINALSSSNKYPDLKIVKKFVSEDIYLNWFRSGHPQYGDILVPTVGTIGLVSMMGKEVGCIAQNLIGLRLNNKLITQEYAFYYMRSATFVKQLFNLDIGGVQSSIKVPHLMKSDIAVPSLNVQKTITKILSSLDDKIELNNKINQALETLAQTLYKHWFVDFEFPNENGEPYKSSGGEMVESELGFVPKGWSIVALKDLIDVIDNRGKTPPLVSSKSDYPIIDVKALSGKGANIDYDNCMKFVSKEVYDNWFRSGHPKHKDVLISTVGSLAEMKLFLRNKGAIAQNVVAFRSVAVDAYYLYYYLQNIKKDLISYNIGSVQPSIKVTHIIKHLLLLPNKTLMDTFSKLIEINITKTSQLHQESKILKMIRDELIPRLMTGEIEVPV